MRVWTLIGTFAVGLMIGATVTAAGAQNITGTASFRERMALPPDAAFEAVLEEVSRADAPATEIARTRIEGPGQPPIGFSIPYDRSAIDERLTYTVRTRIAVGERLLFVSDTANRVITHGSPNEITVMMRKLGGPAATPRAAAAIPVIIGMFVYQADAARLADCRSGRSLPVAMEGDYPRLEDAYLAVRQEPGQPVMITFEGAIEERPRLDGEGTEATAVVSRFIHVWPGETCEPNLADASLINTYWRIVKLDSEELRTTPGRREPHIILRQGEPRFNATVGCNQMAGGYQTEGQSLRFRPGPTTLMACPPPLDSLERALVVALTNTRTWRIHAQFLELFDGEERPLALLQAVYLR